MEQSTQTLQEFDFDALEKEILEYSAGTVSVVDAAKSETEGRASQIADFLAGTATNPSFTYPAQEPFNDELVDAYNVRGSAIILNANIPQKQQSVYESFVKKKRTQVELIASMRRYNADKSDKTAANFMRKNIELYGEPDQATYRSLLYDKVKVIENKAMSAGAQSIFEELKAILPDVSEKPDVERFKPSQETIEWVRNFIEAFYGDLLRYVPENETAIDANGLRQIFENIIRDETNEWAPDWEVELGDVDAIIVKQKSKKIVIPYNRAPVDSAEARRLVVHELIHMIRAEAGYGTDITPLAHGLTGSDDADEGIAKVAEQAIEGKFVESGADHYITAGLAYFDQKDFRGAFEIKWRMKLLEDLTPGEEPTTQQIDEARRHAVDGPKIATTRIFRGTNDLPLFNDLSYYNGSVEIWKYLEEIRGDDLQMSLLFAGRINTSKEHQRVVLESHSY